MAIEQSGFAGAAGVAASGDVTPGEPATIAANHIFICLCHSSDQVSHSMSGDWTQIDQFNGGSTTSRLSAWWHRYDGVTSPSYTITHTGGATICSGIASFSGCITSGSPIDTAGSSNSGTDSSIEHLGVTPTNADCMILAINGAADDNGRSLGTSGYTLSFNRTSSSGTPDGSVNLYYKIHTTGATGDVLINQTGADPWASFLVALKPDVSTPIGAASHYYRQQQRHRQPSIIVPQLITDLEPYRERFNRIENKLAI